MPPDKMIHMANQIAIFFNSQPGDDRVERIAGHLRDFWEPRMLAQLRAHVAQGGGGLDEAVLKAVERL